jgi:hypothetical protein
VETEEASDTQCEEEKILIRKYEREGLLRQSKRRREDNVKMSLKREKKNLYLNHVLTL